MIDLHSHILPGLDDGCKTLEETVEMARIYQMAGFHAVVATPHYLRGTSWCPDPLTILQRVDEVNRALLEQEIKLRVIAGMEIGMDPAIAEFLYEKKLLTLGESSYVLIEVPFQQLPLGYDQMLFDVIAHEYRVILAHPERCEQLMREPERFQQLLNIGSLIQIDWGSLLGHHGVKIARITKELLLGGYVHCLATDSHDLEYRSPKMVKEGMEMLKKMIGEEKAHILAVENPERLLNSETLNLPLPEKPMRKKGWIKRLFPWR